MVWLLTIAKKMAYLPLKMSQAYLLGTIAACGRILIPDIQNTNVKGFFNFTTGKQTNILVMISKLEYFRSNNIAPYCKDLLFILAQVRLSNGQGIAGLKPDRVHISIIFPTCSTHIFFMYINLAKQLNFANVMPIV